MTYDPVYAKRYRLDIEQGRERTVPAAPVRAHINALLADRWSMRAIAELAGVSAGVVSVVAAGKQPTVRRVTARRILAVTPDRRFERINRAGFVLSTGACRRIEALLALGWRHDDISEAAGLPFRRSAVVLHQAGGWIAQTTHDGIVRAYEALSMTPGPSPHTRGRSARLGYAPPLAWDDEDIDDPNATPNMGEAAHGMDLDEWVRLVRYGEDPDRAAERCGVTLSAIARAAYRQERPELIPMLRGAA